MGCGASSMVGRSQKKSHNDSGLDLDGIHRNGNTKRSDSAASSTTSITTMELRQWAATHRLASRHPAQSPVLQEGPALLPAGEVEERIAPIVWLNFVESPGSPTSGDNQLMNQFGSTLASISSCSWVGDGDGSSRGSHSPFLKQSEPELPSSTDSSTARIKVLPRHAGEEAAGTLITSLTNVSAIE